MVDKNLGHYAFMAGVILAIVVGLFQQILDQTVVTLILLILGLVVGFLNVHGKETMNFLIAALVVMLASYAATFFSSLDLLIAPLGSLLEAMLLNVNSFVTPAALVVALKVIKKIAEK